MRASPDSQGQEEVERVKTSLVPGSCVPGAGITAAFAGMETKEGHQSLGWLAQLWKCLKGAANRGAENTKANIRAT